VQIEHSTETWDQVIEPHSKWYKINLKEIWEYRDLIRIFVRRDVVSVYKQTILGPLWLFLGPLFTVFVYTFVFSKIAGISTDGMPAPLFYLAGTTLWNYFQTSFSGISATFVINAGIFGKVYFPRMVSPIASVVSNLLKFGIQLTMFVLFFCYYYFQEDSTLQLNAAIFLLPFLVLLMGGIALGGGIIVSSLTTKYRDLTYFVSFGTSLLMYATPVIYPVSAIPELYKPFLFLNPIAPIVEAFRYSFSGCGNFSLLGLLYSTVFTVVLLIIGMMLFNKTEKTFMDTV
jgi:lipopolysaccharide transport system permease protein